MFAIEGNPLITIILHVATISIIQVLLHSEVEKRLNSAEDTQIPTSGVYRITAHNEHLGGAYGPLTVETYADKFHALLKYEEVAHADLLRERCVNIVFTMPL